MSKKRKAVGLRANKGFLKRQQSSGQATNMFEALWTRNKFFVLGKKQKGQGQRIGFSRSLANDKRKKTLLQEYKQRGKANAFLDRRFGEDDERLGDDDKSIMRFQRERQLQLQRKSKFNLPDEEDEDEEVLTHKGAALAHIDDYVDELSTDEDNEQGLDGDVEDGLKFGGSPEGYKGKYNVIECEKKQRSKKEIMEEVVAKSKFYKALKAKEKEEDSHLKDKLDSEFAALSQSRALLSLVRPKKMNALKAVVSRNALENAVMEKYDPGVSEQMAKEKPDDYDKLMKEMIFDMRAHASDRLKTSEELVKEERERLEELENARKQRMLEDADSDLEETQLNSKNQGENRRLHGIGVSGDDLSENFCMDGGPKKGWVDEVLSRTMEGMKTETDDEDNSDDAEEDSLDSSNTDAEEEEDIEENSGADVNSGRERNSSPKIECDLKQKERELSFNVKKRQTDLVSVMGNQRQLEGLPYVIEAPQSLEEFTKLVGNRSLEELVTVIRRIRACNAISLAVENRKKMQIFYNVLLSYFATVSAQRPVSLQRINALVRPLVEMSSETPYFAAACARERLMQMHKQLSEKLRIKEGGTCWPSIKTIFLLRLWCMIFPSSDFRHAVMTPAILLMGEYLMRCHIVSGRDIVIGSLMCSLLLSVMRHAKRYCPEVLMFLLALFSSALPNRMIAQHHCPGFMLELVASKSWLLLQCDESVHQVMDDLHFNSIIIADDSAPIFGSDNFRLKMLQIAVRNLQGFLNIYADLSCFPEVFAPFLVVLREVMRANKLPDRLKQSIFEALEFIHAKTEEHDRMRQPLRIRVKRPVPIKQFNPKFEENFAQGRNYDPDRERAEKKKLLRQLKREAKGAARELRKDNYFLVEEKMKERVEAEEIRNENYRKAMSFLEGQEAAFKSGQLGKRRKRR
ncbi:hypothetical protein O6H91_10G084500 [Diphasiastrum complanatum]|uniref:Uncharacterized protein n=2 Tax=Diphasiastrum complanatum TaxID=34168 RepID=A0ACC2CJ65_DIPCM|nr:hypothetical protein O6H91_10G084500 [Diphasiastrum complanatum]KAJ7541991.1 hypothetical protein O6H91_10G084500 [Diphasiastrum complanatum]